MLYRSNTLRVVLSPASRTSLALPAHPCATRGIKVPTLVLHRSNCFLSRAATLASAGRSSARTSKSRNDGKEGSCDTDAFLTCWDVRPKEISRTKVTHE